MYILPKKNVENFTKPITLMNKFAFLTLNIIFFDIYSKWIGRDKIPPLILVRLWITVQSRSISSLGFCVVLISDLESFSSPPIYNKDTLLFYKQFDVENNGHSLLKERQLIKI